MKFQWNLGEIHQNFGEIHQSFGEIDHHLVILGDSGVLWGAPNGGRCKKTHYYWSKTTLGHLFLAPQKHLQIGGKAPEITFKTAKFHHFVGEMHQNFGEIHQTFGGIHHHFGDFGWFWGALGSPKCWKVQNDTLLLVQKPLWDTFFGTPKAPQKR